MLHDQTGSDVKFSPKKPSVRFGPYLGVSQIREPWDLCYPLEWDREAELITATDRFALRLWGATCSVTTYEWPEVYRASDGKRFSYPKLMQSLKRTKKHPEGCWYFSVRGLGAWRHPDAKEAHRMACEAILWSAARLSAKTVAA